MISSVSVTNKAGAVAGKKDKLQMAYYICKYSGGTHQGFVDCSVDTDESLIPANSQWPPTDQDVCDFRCIYFHWRLFSQKKEQSVHYEHFGVGPSPDTGKFCIKPSEDVDQRRIGDGHKGDSHDDKGSGDPGTSNTVAGITDSTGRNTGSMATSSTDSIGTDNSSTDSYYSNIGSTASRGTDNGNTDSYNSIIGSSASSSTDSTGTDNSSTDSYYSNIGSTASSGTDNGSTDSYSNIIGSSASSSADRTNTGGGSTDNYNSIIGNSATSSTDSTDTDDGSTNSNGRIIGGTVNSSTDGTDTDNSTTDSYKSDIGSTASSSTDSSNTDNNSADGGDGNNDCTTSSSTCSANTDDARKDGHIINVVSTASSSIYSTNTGDDTGIKDDSSRDSGIKDDSSRDSGIKDDNSKDSDIKDNSRRESDIKDDSSKDSNIKDDSSRDSGNKVGFGPTHHITDNRSDVEFLLVCIAFGASVLANIVLGVCLWCSRRRQRRSQAELNELTGVENLTYFGEDNVRAETSFGNSRYGDDRISAADIDISTNQRDTEVPLGAASVGFVNNGFIPFNNSGEKSLNVNHFEDSDPSASSNNISTQHATQSDINYESFDTGPSAQVTTENVDEPHYAIPRHSQVHVQGTRSTRPAPDQRHSPRLDSSPYGTSQLPEPDPNSSNNFRGTGNDYVDEASLWGAREPQLLTDAGQAVAIIDDQRPQKKSQGSEFTMRSIANGVSGSSAANCGDMDGLYTEPRENVYSEI